MSSKPSHVFTDVDFDAPGKQVGYLYLPYSVTRSAYGNIAIPVCVAANGTGRTVLLMAGTHGDEYEGQVALARFVREVDPGAVQGRLIVLPAINLPAALAGARVSPLDGGNLNRAFPGDPDGGPTGRIAHYLDSVIFPMCDAMHDFHSGGSSLAYLPFASFRSTGEAEFDARQMAALRAFAPPVGMVWEHSLETSMVQNAANARRVVNLGGEFGGRGIVDPGGVSLVEQGLRRFLDHFEVMALPPGAPPAPRTRFMEVRGEHFVLAPDAGLFEPRAGLGDVVEAGQPAGLVHFVDDPAREPVACRFRAAGVVVCQRAMGRVERGDCVFHLAGDRAGAA